MCCIDRLKVFWNHHTDDTSEFESTRQLARFIIILMKFGYQPQRQVNVKPGIFNRRLRTENGIKHFVCITATCIYAYTGVLQQYRSEILLQNARGISVVRRYRFFYYGDGIVNKQYYNPATCRYRQSFDHL